MSKLVCTMQVNNYYGEMNQINELRWKLMWKQEDGSYIDTSYWLKCKDFFNDVVAYLQDGEKFNKYGFWNNVKTNEECVYVLLKNVVEGFEDNLATINRKIVRQKLTPLTWEKIDGYTLLAIPKCFWESTYRISLLTLLIRLCNYGIPIKEWKQFFDPQGVILPEMPSLGMKPEILQWLCLRGFKLTEKWSKFWYYAGGGFSSQQEKNNGMIHNNGVVSWYRAIRQF